MSEQYEIGMRGNAFISGNPTIRVKLAQLAHSYGCAMVDRNTDLARVIEGDALLLKLYYYADSPTAAYTE